MRAGRPPESRAPVTATEALSDDIEKGTCYESVDVCAAESWLLIKSATVWTTGDTADGGGTLGEVGDTREESASKCFDARER